MATFGNHVSWALRRVVRVLRPFGSQQWVSLSRELDDVQRIYESDRPRFSSFIGFLVYNLVWIRYLVCPIMYSMCSMPADAQYTVCFMPCVCYGIYAKCCVPSVHSPLTCSVYKSRNVSSVKHICILRYLCPYPPDVLSYSLSISFMYFMQKLATFSFLRLTFFPFSWTKDFVSSEPHIIFFYVI